jgi:hypothetical protein
LFIEYFYQEEAGRPFCRNRPEADWRRFGIFNRLVEFCCKTKPKAAAGQARTGRRQPGFSKPGMDQPLTPTARLGL